MKPCSLAVFLRSVLCSILITASGSALLFAEPSFIVDTPSTGLLNHGSYDLNFRLFSGGNVLTRLDFGVFRIVNVGLGWEVNKAIGTETTVVGPPALYLKIRPFNGGMILPALAFGYDGQGYFYDRDSKEFAQRERGLFLVIGRELFLPGFELNLGANMYDFSENKLYGFASVTFNIEDTLVVMGEYDNVNYLPDARINAGIRFAVAKRLTIDLAGRDIGAAGRTAERIARINYTGKF